MHKRVETSSFSWRFADLVITENIRATEYLEHLGVTFI
jgi:hypothetical protein